jgi:hypothetical protein
VSPIEIATLAEEALLNRQKLPILGADAVKPSYDGLGLPNVAALAVEWLCPDAPQLHEQPSLPPFNPELLEVKAVTDAWKNWQQQAPIKHVVFLIMDGLGYDQLRTLMDEDVTPGIKTACHQSRAFFIPATSVFPSATVNALTCAATAYAPAQHGLMSTRMFFPRMGNIIDLIRFKPLNSPSSTSYSDTQFNPDKLLSVPNLYLRMEKAGVNVEIVNSQLFRNSGITRFTSVDSQAGRDKYFGYQTPADGFAQVRERLLANLDKDKSFTHIYIPNIDMFAHRYGPLSFNYRAEIAGIDFSLRRELLEPLAGRNDTVLILVADHGQRSGYADKTLWLDQHPQLTQMFSMPSTGETQCRFLHLMRDTDYDALPDALNYIQQNFGEHFFALSKIEAIEIGLFGEPSQPPCREYLQRIGDLILIPREDWISSEQSGEPSSAEGRPAKNGVHGGVSRAEMLIPFLAYRF